MDLNYNFFSKSKEYTACQHKKQIPHDLVLGLEKQ